MHPLLVRYSLARPNARSSHKTPTPQGGGIAVIGATTAALAAAAMLMPSLVSEPRHLSEIIACAIALSIVGVIDDIRPLDASLRLVLQGIAALAAMSMLPPQLHIVPALPYWLERGLLFVGLLWFVNVTNFMDGLDWMTVAAIVPVTAALWAFGLLGALPSDAMLIALALCGAMIGFAPFNKPVAKLFLGDVGSLPIGLLVGWLLTVLAENHLAAAILLPLYYAADATITLGRRIVNGAKLTQAHREHFYQHAFDGGMSVTVIVGHVFWLNVALALLAAATLVNASLLLHLGAIGLGCILVGLTLLRFERAKA
jgi:UDP-N-acetylmuramyl pentapeptide phosphotransferase/UDP-N-acetylglucosamine-1-phosphate transferase